MKEFLISLGAVLIAFGVIRLIVALVVRKRERND